MKKKTKKIRCLVYSRVVGYIRPTDLWSDAKQLEFSERLTYDIPSMSQLEGRKTSEKSTVFAD